MLRSLMARLDNSFISDAEYLGYNVRLMSNNLMSLNVYGKNATDIRDEYISTDYKDRHMTEIGHKKKMGQRVEDIILDDLNPNETLIVMAIDPDNDDAIHFYRRDPSGAWTEKPGKDPVTVAHDPFITPEDRIQSDSTYGSYKIISAFAIS